MIHHDSLLTKVKVNKLYQNYVTKRTGLIVILLLQVPILLYFYEIELIVFPRIYFAHSVKNATSSNRSRILNNAVSTVLNTGTWGNKSSNFSSIWTKSTAKNVNKSFNTKLILQTTVTLISIEVTPSFAQCPETPPNLQGKIYVSFADHPHSMNQIEEDNPFVTNGGYFKPTDCIANSKVAIIIPFRNRDMHLKYFLQFMHPTLQHQQLEYRVYIINQHGKGKFNRAKLMNVGFMESIKDLDFQCFVFHDVDLVLENDYALYNCPEQPRHLSSAIDKFNYRLPYQTIFGGVTELTKEQFTKVNGFSNSFWGWGGEDDDMFNRIRISKMNVVRYLSNVSRYKMIKHKKDAGNEPNPKRFELVRKTYIFMKKDGLNNLKYEVISRDIHNLYTNITVNLFGPN